VRVGSSRARALSLAAIVAAFAVLALATGPGHREGAGPNAGRSDVGDGSKGADRTCREHRAVSRPGPVAVGSPRVRPAGAAAGEVPVRHDGYAAVLAPLERHLGRTFSAAERRVLRRALRSLRREARLAESGGGVNPREQAVAARRRAARASRAVVDTDGKLMGRLGFGAAAIARALDRDAIEDLRFAPVDFPQDAAQAFAAELTGAKAPPR
jgi:hypothetical protein